VISDRDSKAVSIPKDSLYRLIEESSKFRRFVFSNYSISILSMLNCVEMALTLPIEQRLAKLLLDRKTEVIGVTHQGLADEMGTAREVVSRILKEFEEKGMVQLKRGMITIQDREGLAQTLQTACN
jgi:CRP/FNR family transcriptional regulator